MPTACLAGGTQVRRLGRRVGWRDWVCSGLAPILPIQLSRSGQREVPTPDIWWAVSHPPGRPGCTMTQRVTEAALEKEWNAGTRSRSSSCTRREGLVAPGPA